MRGSGNFCAGSVKGLLDMCCASTGMGCADSGMTWAGHRQRCAWAGHRLSWAGLVVVWAVMVLARLGFEGHGLHSEWAVHGLGMGYT
jgi:hypothetical protein